MKYRKLTLDSSTVGLINDRLNRITSSGIFKVEHTQGDQNPTKKNIDFGKHPSFQRNRTVQVRGKDFPWGGPGLFIYGDGIGWYGGTPFDFGDIFYLGNNVIFVKSGKPDAISKKIRLIKITLLSRSDAPHAMSAYREAIRSKIKMNCYYCGWDRLHISDSEVNEHIAFLDKNKGKGVENPRYPTKDGLGTFDDNEDSDFDDEGDDIDKYLNAHVFDE
ncbi:hypothetical protein IT402_02370 [Candidatus Nomurabacteria bacterium]|nr:hypothetical protein [Candidatus Nomurabacteria bacterium]